VRATILFSGGIDSSSCIHLLRRDGYEVSGLFVDFGQASARMERRSVELLSNRLVFPVNIVEASANRNFGSGELQGRNAFLIFSALLLGGCNDGLLVLGIHAGTPYFDCSPAFIERIEPLVQECTDGRVSVLAPFVHWIKDDVYSYFIASGIPLTETYSCEGGTNPPCGSCTSCKDRARLECLLNGVR
jgi:7-cyano-7-deazaguanine synthase